MNKSTSNTIKTTKTLILILTSILIFNSSVNNPAQAQNTGGSFQPTCDPISTPVCEYLRPTHSTQHKCTGVPNYCTYGRYDPTKDTNGYINYIESREDFGSWTKFVDIPADYWKWYDNSAVGHYNCVDVGKRETSEGTVSSEVCNWQQLVPSVHFEQHLDTPVEISVGGALIHDFRAGVSESNIGSANITVYHNSTGKSWSATGSSVIFDNLDKEGNYTVMASKGGSFITGYAAFHMNTPKEASHLIYKEGAGHFGVQARATDGTVITKSCTDWEYKNSRGGGFSGGAWGGGSCMDNSIFPKDDWVCWNTQSWEGEVSANCMGKTLTLQIPALREVDPTPASEPNPNCPRFSEGDANCDGEIKKDDFVLWLNSYRERNDDADFNRKRGTDKADFVIWLNSYREEDL